MVLAGIRAEEENSVAYAIGAGIGTGAAAVGIAALIRLGWTRLIVKRGEVGSPWLLAIAAVVAIVGLVGDVAREQEDEAEAEEIAASLDIDSTVCAGTVPPFPPLPSGAIIAIPGYGEGERLSEFLAGFAAGIEDRGGTPEEVTINSQQATVGDVTEAYSVGGHAGCWAVGIYGLDERIALSLARQALSP